MRILLLLVFVLSGICSLYSKNKREYHIPKIYYKGKIIQPSSMNILFADSTMTQNCISAERMLPKEGRNQKQRVKLSFKAGEQIFDTTLAINSIRYFIFKTDIGGGGEEYRLHVLPVKEYDFLLEKMSPPYSYLELSGFLGYSSTDETSKESSREVGFNDFYYGGEFLIAPFGNLLGNEVSLGLGIEALMERSRLRIPVKAQLRYTFGKEDDKQKMYFYYPNNYTFSDETRPDHKVQPPPKGLTDMSGAAIEFDKGSYIKSEFKKDTSGFSKLKPFIYIEGGPIFNGSFDGAGAEPSDNPEDYSQYFGGAGAGVLLWKRLTISLSYRYMRLNLRTLCSECDDRYLVNTNKIHSVMLKVGVRLFEW